MDIPEDFIFLVLPSYAVSRCLFTRMLHTSLHSIKLSNAITVCKEICLTHETVSSADWLLKMATVFLQFLSKHQQLLLDFLKVSLRSLIIYVSDTSREKFPNGNSGWERRRTVSSPVRPRIRRRLHRQRLKTAFRGMSATDAVTAEKEGARLTRRLTADLLNRRRRPDSRQPDPSLYTPLPYRKL